jgi:tripartite ATP-independent transporter DctM subunit
VAWQLLLLIIFGSLVVLMLAGMPVAFAFMTVNFVGVLLLWGGFSGLEQLTFSINESIGTFILIPIPLFILMGEVMFHSGIVPHMLDALDKLLGRLPGRLSLLAVAGSTIFATLTGVSMGSVALLGSTLLPEMERLGYKKPMSIGPIAGSGCLAIMIPPTILGILLGGLGQIDIGAILVGIIVPGLMMAAFYAAYIIIRCWLQPSIAPPYEVPPMSLAERILPTIKYVLPIAFIIFLVIGVIFMGVATPSEAAATGALGCFILAAIYRRLDWQVVKKSFWGCLQLSVMLLMIIVGARAFGQILTFSGATRGLVAFATSFPVAPIFILIIMQFIVLMLGCLMELASIIMITIPVFMPIVHTLGINEVWFAIVMMLSVTMGTISPPFGLDLFAMKGVAPPGTTMGDIYRATLPFLLCDLVVLALVIIFPTLALWLPSMMG